MPLFSETKLVIDLLRLGAGRGIYRGGEVVFENTPRGRVNRCNANQMRNNNIYTKLCKPVAQNKN